MRMSNADYKEQARKQRISIVRALKIKDIYQRPHTSTGVFRRKDLLNAGFEPPPMKSNVSVRSLGNLKSRPSLKAPTMSRSPQNSR